MTDPQVGVVHKRFRRGRTSRHRRNRLIRRVFTITVLSVFVLGLSAVALFYISPSIFASRPVQPRVQKAEIRKAPLALATEEETPAGSANRPVYPYSVIAGGVEDARELKWVAEHDPVVAFHYRGFNFANAHVVRLALEQNVYVSYRIGNQVYWTHHPVKLKKGEKLITDGTMTARTRCGNRVEEVPQQATSASEPPAEKFEEPVHESQSTAMIAPPVPFQSALLNRPRPNIDPLPASSLYNPFYGGNWTPISAPPIPSGLCGPTKKKKDEAGDFELPSGDSGSGGKKKKGVGACGQPAGTAPEPGAWILMISGLAFIAWQARRRMLPLQ